MTKNTKKQKMQKTKTSVFVLNRRKKESDLDRIAMHHIADVSLPQHACSVATLSGLLRASCHTTRAQHNGPSHGPTSNFVLSVT